MTLRAKLRSPAEWTAGLLFSGKQRQRRLVNVAVFLFLLLPVLAIGTFSYLQSHRDLTSNTYDRRQALAFLTAATLEQKFYRLTDLGISLATRVRFRQMVGQGKWDEAIAILQSVPRDFPSIDRITLNDLQGTLMADTPALPGVRGRNFAHRDWYLGVSKNWEPYLSEVYQRAAEPRYNVVAVATPIKSETGGVVAILVLQVKMDTLLDWTKDIEVGPSGFVYVVDKKGKIAAHPKSAAQGEIVDYSSVPAVQKVLRGERGVEILFNPIEREERLTAYAPVPRYGWGVIAQQATTAAFAARDGSLHRILITYGLIFLFVVALALLILHTLARRRRAEERLKASEERFRSMAETAEDAIVSADREGNITYFNRGAERMFGYGGSEVVGRPLTRLMPDRLHAAHRAGLERYVSTEESRVIGKPVELVGRRTDGTEFPFELSLSSWKTDKGVFFTGILRDMTERKRFEEELLSRNQQIQNANKELEAFTYSVSHDLRAPLRAIDGFSRILLEKHGAEMAEDAKRFQNLIRNNAQQMGRLIDDLLAFSRLSRQPLNRRPVAPAEIVREALHDLGHEYRNGGPRISVRELPGCQADPSLLKQVYVNLLSNAIKYSRAHETAQIEVGFMNGDGEPTFYVRDNGVGFDMKYADKLFGVFQRLHRAEDYEGTGVGLAIVQRIVHRHGGRVWADAEVDKGATFYFTLGGRAR
jgi:PAS domain S-box-containing protein